MAVRVHGGIFDNQSILGSLRYFDIEFTNLTVDHIADGNQQVINATVVNGGTGYVGGDIGGTLTGSGGTGTQPTFELKIIDGDEVVGISILTAGDYSVIPANPVTLTGLTGSGVTVDLDYTSTIIIPGAGTGSVEYFVPTNKAVANSAVDQVLTEISKLGTIVQIAVESADIIRVVLENDSMGWDTPAAGNAAAEMEDAIQALGTVTVPDTTTDGVGFDLSTTTVAERLLSGLS